MDSSPSPHEDVHQIRHGMSEDQRPKPTIAELEAILDSPEALELEILPDGSVHAVPMGTAKDAKPVILTSKYMAAEFY